jgi:hypothetical protein
MTSGLAPVRCRNGSRAAIFRAHYIKTIFMVKFGYHAETQEQAITGQAAVLVQYG